MTSTVLSLFAGIGGIDIAFERLGCRTDWYSEYDPKLAEKNRRQYAAEIMALRFPNAVNLGDITTIDWTRFDGRPDIICGGFPCQDISLAGKGRGIEEGTRSGLWKYYADAVRCLRPRIVFVENVSALTSRGLDRVLRDLASCGYDAEWDCIPASSVGAPHRRDRIWIIAYPSAVQRAAKQRAAKQRHESHGDHESVGDVADSAGAGAGRERAGVRGRSTGKGEVVTDTDSERWQRSTAEHRETGRPIVERSSRIGEPAVDDAMRGRYRPPQGEVLTRWHRPEHSDWWRVEPNVGRVAHGVSSRVDRLRCLGNAVVPAVAEHVAKIALQRMYERS